MIDWLKAKIALLIIAIVWCALILVCLPLMVTALIYDKWINPKTTWLYSIFLGQDYLTSAILGNSHQTTISALLGYMMQQGSTSGTMVAKLVDLLFYLARGEVNHCSNAMRDTDVYQFSARRALLGFSCYCLGMGVVFVGIASTVTAVTEFIEFNWG